MFRSKSNHKARRIAAFGRVFTMFALVAVCLVTTGCGGGRTVVIQQPPPVAPGVAPPTTGTTVTALPPTVTTTTTTTGTTTTTAVVPTPLATPLPPLVDPFQNPPGLTPPPTAFPPFPPGGYIVIKRRITKEITIIRPIGTGPWQTPPIGPDGQPIPLGPDGQPIPGYDGTGGPMNPWNPAAPPVGTTPPTAPVTTTAAPGQPVVETTVTVVRDPAQLQGALQQK